MPGVYAFTRLCALSHKPVSQTLAAVRRSLPRVRSYMGSWGPIAGEVAPLRREPPADGRGLSARVSLSGQPKPGPRTGMLVKVG